MGAYGSNTPSLHYSTAPVKVDGVDARTLVLSRGTRAVVVVADYVGGGAAKVTLDRKALALPDGAAAKDLETGQPVESPAPGVFTFELKKHDFKALIVE